MRITPRYKIQLHRVELSSIKLQSLFKSSQLLLKQSLSGNS